MGILNWINKKREEIILKRSAKTAFEQLIDESQLQERFLVMSGLSGIVATCGIILRDQSILIAAMVLAPLLNPLLALGAGIARWHRGLMFFAVKAFAAGFGVVLVVTTLLSLLLVELGVPVDGTHILARFDQFHTLPVLLVVAFFSGFAAVYAWLKNSSSANFVAVAIAVALIPFVSLYGVFIASGAFGQMGRLTVILFSNLLLIVSGAVFAFLVIGLRVSRDEVTEELKERAAPSGGQ